MGDQVTREDLERMLELLPSMYDRTVMCASCYLIVSHSQHWSCGLPHCSQECADKTKERWDIIQEDIEKKRDRR